MAGILDAYGQPMRPVRNESEDSVRANRRAYARRQQPNVRGRYDAAEFTPDNIRHWRTADGLSADAANSPGVRRTLRNRARHEVVNNPYLRGMTHTLANDVIGSGPRLQIPHADLLIAAE